MKKYLVIGYPIEHSLSPPIHNHWIKKYHLIDSIYEKKKVEKEDLGDIVNKIKNEEIKGVNVTVPFKKEIIPFLDCLDGAAERAHSVNTLCKVNNEVWGYNTDTQGFKTSLTEDPSIDLKNKNILILGAGGVTSSILETFLDVANKIYITNRTKEKAKELKKLADISLTLIGRKKIIEVIDWGEKLQACDIIINTTSVGLIENDNLDLNFKNYENNKNVLFYDVIYSPKETNFLKDARLRGNKTINGKMMFLRQAQIAFQIWTNIRPEIDDEVIELLD
jgi:shikimate dehydrogenase